MRVRLLTTSLVHPSFHTFLSPHLSDTSSRCVGTYGGLKMRTSTSPKYVSQKGDGLMAVIDMFYTTFNVYIHLGDGHPLKLLNHHKSHLQ